MFQPSLNHLALIMDGNRRWAKGKGLPECFGHQEGAKKIQLVIDFCLQKGISFLSLYTLSIENFLSRKQSEKDSLKVIIKDVLNFNIEEAITKGVAIKFVGDRSLFGNDLLESFQLVEEKTAFGRRLTVFILFCYGGMQDILFGVNKFSQLFLQKKFKECEIDIDFFGKLLWSSNIPAIDLVIRTGGRKRISNFLPWQIAYAEIYFLDVFWPDLDPMILESSYQNFLKSERTFGH